MQVNMRQERRRTGRQLYTLCWESEDGMTRNADARGIDISRSGIRVSSPLPIPPETVVFVRAHNGDTLNGNAVVRHCLPHGDAYAIGMAFQEETKATVTFPEDGDINYYTFLQVSPKADWPTIHRIYRIMASRFHPDNPETGDPDKFLILQKALETLSDPNKRKAYDASLLSVETETMPIFELSEFVNGIDGEVNRRLGIVSLLYNRRRTSPHSPGISLLDLEKRMAMPREYLEFTIWYLKSKQYVTFGDNSELVLTALGVDYVESNYPKIPVLQRLLDSGPSCATSSKASHDGSNSPWPEKPLLHEGDEQAEN
jgi:hypothetical protein